ncbi:MAG: M20 family metallopeptidase [Bacteroidales bacterium]|nr:M20 family metallopeptidase [Bacteroidales bacterium]
MPLSDIVKLTQKLITFNTINPPGNESDIALFVGKLLSGSGFSVKYPVFAEKRLHLIAEKGLSKLAAPVVLSGHFDTVPLGAKKWDLDPLSGEISGDKIFGRGSSDMKSGLAAMIYAAISSFENTPPLGGIRLIFTAGEELGCQGAVQLAETYSNFGEASVIIIGEPTSNIPAIGHKGALYLNAFATGITAHSSMPELGENAIYKAARAIRIIEKFSFGVEKDSLLGFPTVNVGKMNGGMNINSVPDHAEFTIDIRSTGKVAHKKVIEKLNKDFGDDIKLEILVDLKPVRTNEADPIVQKVYAICKEEGVRGVSPKSLPYMTDGSVLQSLYNGAPTIILGPGQPEMAHQTDEFCYIQNINQAVNIYKKIILKTREKK